ncbi:protein ECERIFERUM 16 [Magnolia sinica]|uniref:protein ECERIFERUM 16 n=1 Tax=Magnolia sinica TaxID=86752 RepID=UPI002658A294|nr:protein ECERIFERUM 16 [Magnolia sinica]
MDSKASAKSKRAHSLRGNNKKSPHSNPNPGNLPQSAPNSNKNQSRENNRRSHAAPALPSNWDRYHEDGIDSNTEDPSVDVDHTGRADIVAPKSKGADFAELISQAQTDARARTNPNPESFVSFDDVLPDLNQGVSAMLSVRGKCLLSWCGDDNFIVDDNATSSYEASFLSMDLHALAAQLEKIDVSERLFIEVDLLPAELHVDVSKESSSQGYGVATLGANAGCSDDEKTLNYRDEVMPSTDASIASSQAVGGHDTIQRANKSASFLTTSEEGAKPDPLNQRGFVESTPQFNLYSAADSKEKTSRFQAAAAEAELDMLLNSFGETTPLDSISIDEKKPNKAEAAVVELDMFLNSFSETMPLDSVSIDKKKPGNDFPAVECEEPDASRHVSMAVSLDDAIDDLLGETSITGNQKNGPLLGQERGAPVNLPSHSSSNSVSKALDDFDSWLDTL